VINGGGIISIASEIRALEAGGVYDPAWVEMKLACLVQTLDAILERGLRERRPTQEIAIDIAQARIDAARTRARVLEYS
jgi:leucine dehydrogenase